MCSCGHMAATGINLSTALCLMHIQRRAVGLEKRTRKLVHGIVKNFVPMTSGVLASDWLAKRPTRCSDDCPPLMPW